MSGDKAAQSGGNDVGIDEAVSAVSQKSGALPPSYLINLLPSLCCFQASERCRECYMLMFHIDLGLVRYGLGGCDLGWHEW